MKSSETDGGNYGFFFFLRGREWLNFSIIYKNYDRGFQKKKKKRKTILLRP